MHGADRIHTTVVAKTAAVSTISAHHYVVCTRSTSQSVDWNQETLVSLLVREKVQINPPNNNCSYVIIANQCSACIAPRALRAPPTQQESQRYERTRTIPVVLYDDVHFSVAFRKPNHHCHWRNTGTTGGGVNSLAEHHHGYWHLLRQKA